MKKIHVGVIDYQAGNHASVVNSLKALGFRVTLARSTELLDSTDLLLLPGVGAFPQAMDALREEGLEQYIRTAVEQKKRPLIGICLGMQLLASSSSEYGETEGLGLIPGHIQAMDKPKWHIGWNSIIANNKQSSCLPEIGGCYYFNHSFCFKGSDKSVLYRTADNNIAAVIAQGHVVGLQFHPEKSQKEGRALLKNLILRMCNA
ncbi:imidazole glycerol phosphate synthase subunit HisH [Neptuniibacter sp. QD37_6]|uniref:imidazole glycerol phosphate synthase subunit HisH n=1 Tax=Neptuniibacter sp. QD37_6 TaxID=3398210 RepID=UPI0039F61DEB